MGAGKGTVVGYLVKKRGFKHYSVRDLLITEINKRGLKVDRNNMVAVANELRKRYGPSYIAETLFKKAEASGKNSVIESLRNPSEVEALRNKGNFYLLAVDANPKLRYERVKKRGSETDNISYEEFLENDKREMDSKDKNRQNIAECIKMADYRLRNNGAIEKLHKKIEKILDGLEKKVRLRKNQNIPAQHGTVTLWK